MCAKKSLSIDDDLVAEAQRRADANYGGNLSAAISAMLRESLEAKTGMSKLHYFHSEIGAILSEIGIRVSRGERVVDWVLPDLKLGLEGKIKFKPGQAETATVSVMAYTIGQSLCEEIWIVVPDEMTEEDFHQFTRISKEFTLAPIKLVHISRLESAVRARAKERGIYCSPSAPLLKVAETQRKSQRPSPKKD